ncbi:hypothetical protein O6H91_20G018600 [Diphasiastrum complanatum]|uniref:Uncharacterized protein n=1 Tax=Diphasiastrum complanatum TaxID=34168 RepID=A0ACC2ANP0_DIPCM|nr:hypothetical protein O6H91_Y431200 [Diphasiastrum complanatum]KAJ7519001.1 hypothetical protein O6H91_20G018600 [Diphasiastrum complanatum]
MGFEDNSELNAAAMNNSSEVSLEVAAEHLLAPQGWQKKLAVRKGGTPRRRDVVFIAPNGEEITTKRQLERYLKQNPGGPSISEFDWSTGGTPRRSERLSSKSRLSTDSAEDEQTPKRRKETPQKVSKEDQGVEEKDEISPVATAKEILPDDEEPTAEIPSGVEPLAEVAVVKPAEKALDKDIESTHLPIEESHTAVSGVDTLNGGIGDKSSEYEEPIRELHHGKSEAPAYLTVSKSQESRPAEVGVST